MDEAIRCAYCGEVVVEDEPVWLDSDRLLRHIKLASVDAESRRNARIWHHRCDPHLRSSAPSIS